MLKATSGPFEIHRERTDGHDHFMKMEYDWYVLDVRTGQRVLVVCELFEGIMSGASEVVFDKRGREVVVTDHDGSVTRHPLPVEEV